MTTLMYERFFLLFQTKTRTDNTEKEQEPKTHWPTQNI